VGAIRQAFARNLAHHRQRLGLTQAKLAEAVDSSPSYIGHLERGEREPSLLTIEELCRALGIQAGELFVERQSKEDREALDRELTELLRDRTLDDLRLITRLARAAFEDPRLASQTAWRPTSRSRPTRRRPAR
jgi:transcriptional regulator with XRE-family HTH domain